jgi:hypothetical protein
MNSIGSTTRRSGSALVLALALCSTAVPVAAGQLIRFTDLQPGGGAILAPLSDVLANWAVPWTQTVTSSNVTLSAVFSSNIGAASGDWYVTRSIGPGTTSADVVTSGVYNVSSQFSLAQFHDFNLAPRTVLGTGLSFAPGTYFLVLDGPAGRNQNNLDWTGEEAVGAFMAPGFSVGSFSVAGSNFGLGTAAFAPAGNFSEFPGFTFVFEMDGNTAAIPLPASLPLLAAGLAMLGLVWRRTTAQS